MLFSIMFSLLCFCSVHFLPFICNQYAGPWRKLIDSIKIGALRLLGVCRVCVCRCCLPSKNLKAQHYSHSPSIFIPLRQASTRTHTPTPNWWLRSDRAQLAAGSFCLKVFVNSSLVQPCFSSSFCFYIFGAKKMEARSLHIVMATLRYEFEINIKWKSYIPPFHPFLVRRRSQEVFRNLQNLLIRWESHI